MINLAVKAKAKKTAYQMIYQMTFQMIQIYMKEQFIIISSNYRRPVSSIIKEKTEETLAK